MKSAGKQESSYNCKHDRTYQRWENLLKVPSAVKLVTGVKRRKAQFFNTQLQDTDITQLKAFKLKP